ncbi:MAG TPA: GC-type dockerin domain-anchored protein [Phycisphaerales bacterium]|nr:GC-type dockerin domain-anchored protein [Phycisphaerales bacterium]
MVRTAPLAALLLTAGSACSVVHAQSWASPVDGAWFDALKWSPQVVPTGPGATGTLGLVGSYRVITTGHTLMSVDITNPAATLSIFPNHSLALAGSAPGVVNTLDGTLVVNETGAYAGTNLSVGTSAVAFAGSGVIRLNASTSDGNTTANTAAVVSGGGSLTMGAGTTLAGFGIVNNTPSINSGTFTADVAGRPLRIEGQNHTNNGLYTAANTGVLVISQASITQGGGGSIAPGADSAAQFHSSSVHGGTISSSGTGRAQVVGGAVTLGAVSIAGGLDIYGNTITSVDAPLNLVGGATVTVNQTATYAGTHVRAAAPGTAVNGSGTIRLNASTSDGNTTANTAALSGSGAGSWVFGPGVNVAGFGIITGVDTTNNGVYNADVNGRLFRIEGAVHQNNNLYTATGGGVLYASNATINQAPGAVFSAVGAGDNPSSAQFANSAVSGGSLVSNGAAHVRVASSSSVTFGNVNIVGTLDQGHNSALYIDAPGVNLAPGSTLLVNAEGAYSGTYVRTGEPVAFTGAGTVRLNASTSDGSTTANTAALMEDGGDAGGSFTFAPGVTLAGFGIVTGVPTVNNGVFTGDTAGRPLRLEGASHQNNNLYTSANTGQLLLANTTVNQSGAARIHAGNDSTVALFNARIVGGTVGSPAGGSGVTYNTNTLSWLEGVTVSRQLQQEPNGILATTGMTLSNNAVVTINTPGAYAGTRLRANAAPAVIGGGGTIRLNASTSDGNTTAGTAELVRDGSVAGAGFTFAPGVTVDGFGRIFDCPTTNNGVVDANTAGRPLRIESNTHQNNGAFRSSNGGYLDFASATVVQSGAGAIVAGDASSVNLGASDISGGSLNAAGSGRFSVFASSNLHGLTSNAPLDVIANHAAIISEPGIVNNGVIKVNHSSAYAGTTLRAAGAAVTLSGSGSVLLNRSGSDGNATAGTADLSATAGSSWSFGAGQTLTGSGRITAPVTMNGTIAPGIPGANGFIRNDSIVTFGATGRLHIDIATGSNYDQLQNAGSVALDGTLQVVSAMDFPAGTTFDVITGGTHTGEFDTVLSSGLAQPKRFGARYDNPTRVRVTVLCGPADIAGQGADGNGDGILDNNDFIVFIDRFFANDPRADYGSTGGILGPDGQWNNNDFVVFIDLFFAGCF